VNTTSILGHPSVSSGLRGFRGICVARPKRNPPTDPEVLLIGVNAGDTRRQYNGTVGRHESMFSDFH
jgi:hypothetical protein